ncbi:MAG: hypothetical protein M3T55_01300 [Pseudomonadota bacterium]|nr:hypothetical protein [Pseudomonadota bacterium]
MKLRSLFILPVALTLFTSGAQAAVQADSPTTVDTIQVGEQLPRAALLKPGVRRYARYMIDGDSRVLMDLWTRQLSYEEQDGRRIMRIRQRWDAADKSYVAHFDQTFEPGTFRPFSQTQTVIRGGASKSLSVTIADGKVDSTGDGGTEAAKPLHKAFGTTFYNWHTDMELLKALPLARGYAASIPFYDVGLDPPARYIYKVAGEEVLPAADGTPIKCWLVLFQEKPTEPVVRFWFSERNQILIREETKIPGQGTLVKTLLNAEAEDRAA